MKLRLPTLNESLEEKNDDLSPNIPEDGVPCAILGLVNGLISRLGSFSRITPLGETPDLSAVKNLMVSNLLPQGSPETLSQLVSRIKPIHMRRMKQLSLMHEFVAYKKQFSEAPSCAKERVKSARSS